MACKGLCAATASSARNRSGVHERHARQTCAATAAHGPSRWPRMAHHISAGSLISFMSLFAFFGPPLLSHKQQRYVCNLSGNGQCPVAHGDKVSACFFPSSQYLGRLNRHLGGGAGRGPVAWAKKRAPIGTLIKKNGGSPLTTTTRQKACMMPKGCPCFCLFHSRTLAPFFWWSASRW